MNKEMKKAWKQTKEKWEDIFIHKSFSIYSPMSMAGCGLCALYNRNHCKNCPVMICNGDKYCRGLDFPDYYFADQSYLFLLFVYEATKDMKEYQ